MSDRLKNGHSTVALPCEWRRDKIARLCELIGSGGTPPTGNPDFYNGGIPWVQTGDLKDDWLNETEKTITEEGLRNSAAQLYPKNTLLVAMYGATIGKLGILKFFAAVNQACCALVVRKTIDMRFMFYTLRSLRADLIAEALGGGQQNIGQETIKQTYVVHPPLPEQQRIAAYLDASCTAIDAAVGAKRRQLEVLNDLRKSIIQSAVTKGFDMHVVTRDSGSEDFGRIPVHWRSDRMKDLVVLRNEKTDEASEEVDYLELEDIESSTGRILNRRNTVDVQSAVTIFRKGDVLFGKLRPYLSKYIHADFDGKCTGEILAFRPIKITSRFLFYCVASPWFIERCNAIAYGAKMPRVNWQTQLASFVFPLPPVKEQDEICRILDSKLAEIRGIVTAIEAQIATLTSYRKSLTHECVTGQRRVTDADINRVKAHV